MENFIVLTRILTAIVAPIVSIVLSILAIWRSQRDQGQPPEPGVHCLRCGKARFGDHGQFKYSENMGNPRRQAIQSQLKLTEQTILGSESHFICDICARGYLLRQVLQIGLMVLPYPLYLYVVLPILGESGFFANFLIETILVLFVLAGTTAAFDLFRAAREGETSLAEMRDRVAIKIRKKFLGKNHTYQTRLADRPPGDKPR